MRMEKAGHESRTEAGRRARMTPYVGLEFMNNMAKTRALQIIIISALGISNTGGVHW